ncbi:MAG: triose-phosphate isomerase [Bacteroidota bacterium]
MIVAGNWKMNLGLEDAVSLAADVVRATADNAGDVTVVVCPPAIWLDAVSERVSKSRVALGSQNVHPESSGAFTGEHSVGMLLDVGVSYVIVGHSERRQLFRESSAFVAEKVIAAQNARLVPIVCVGETLEERDAGDAVSTVLDQLAMSLEGTGPSFVVAYEPVWAIGTGRTASPDQAQQMHAAIRSQLASNGHGGVPVLYGGSVKPANAADLFAQPDIDGALVGGASLTADSFAAIVSAAGAAS